MNRLDRMIQAGASPAMHPVAFDGLFGWLHAPAGLAADTGVVMVAPLGRDERCGRLPMRRLAERMAAAGFPVLRYDHRGQCDSLPLPPEAADALPTWLADVAAAAGELRRRTGVTRVVLAGLRIGGGLAALQASAADGLILLAPVLNGAAWIRRLQFLARAGQTPGLDHDGLHLSAETTASLSAIDLYHAAAPTAPVFVAAQNGKCTAWGEHMARRGADVRMTDFPGFDDLFLDAHSNLPPDEVFAEVVAWLDSRFAGARRAVSIKSPAKAELQGEDAVEQAVTFGAGLHGVLCRPAGETRRNRAVIFCNTGGDPRSGIGGFATEASRALARAGVASLRFDFAGLGDSAMPGGKVRSHVYETPRQADMAAAVDCLHAHGYERASVVGVCSGAHHALRLSARDPRIAEVFAISPVKLVWRKGDSLVFGKADLGRATSSYLDSLAERRTWRRLVRGQLDVTGISRMFGGRVRARALGAIDRLSGRSPLKDMRALAARGGRALLLMGLGDVSLDEVETYFGPKGARLKRLPRMTVRVVPQLDHGLALRESRRIALDMLVDWMVEGG